MKDRYLTENLELSLSKDGSSRSKIIKKTLNTPYLSNHISSLTEYSSPDLNKNIFSLIEKNALKHPNKVAICFNNKKITYRKLILESKKIALYLLENGAKKNDFIAVYQERSIELLTSILGILSIGCCYVPIDIKCPLPRFDYIVKNSGCKFMLTKKELAESFKSKSIFNKNFIIEIDSDLISSPKKNSNFHDLTIINSTDYAYLIYTSGSTGSPKGVMITHKNVINYALWFTDIFEFGNSSIIDFSSSIAFDLSVSCTLVPLIKGGRIVICPNETKMNPQAYLKNLNDFNVTHVEWTPDYFHHLLDLPDEIRLLNKLKWIMLGADTVVKKDVERWLNLNRKCKIANEYGPTECTVAITAHIITKDNIHNYGNIPIGKPAYNTEIYVLDPDLKICPAQQAGELYIAGLSVSPGYIDPDQTSQSFIPNPFNSKYTILYRTGDIVRILPDGNLEFLGRRDDQVKIRGFRVELKEVEETLLLLPFVKQCKVLTHNLNQNERIMIGYLVTDTQNSLPFLHEHLKKYLPDYMIPSRFIFLNRFETTNNGKINIDILKSLANQRKNENNKLNFLNNEEMLKKIWKEIFNLDSINPDDNFFTLGGTSLTVLSMLNKIYRTFQIRLQTAAILKYPTIRSLSKSIDHIQSNLSIKISLTEIRKKPQIISLNSSKKSPPLFLIHPIGGTVFIYQALAMQLAKTCRVYGLQDPGIEDISIRFTSLIEMGGYYLHAIRKIQPQGPYRLAGASFGATLAIEISRQLKTLDEEVSFLGLFDGWALYPKCFLNKRYFKKFMLKRTNSSEVDENSIQRLIDMQFSRECLLSSYHIPKFSEKITLFKSKILWPEFKKCNSADNGWGLYFTNLQVYDVPGNHESMFYHPYINELSNALIKYLDLINK